jgi:hypothetical protein
LWIHFCLKGARRCKKIDNEQKRQRETPMKSGRCISMARDEDLAGEIIHKQSHATKENRKKL